MVYGSPEIEILIKSRRDGIWTKVIMYHPYGIFIKAEGCSITGICPYGTTFS